MNEISARSLGPRSAVCFAAVSMGILLLSPVIAAVIDDDGRMTEEEYAKAKGQPLEEIQARFAATGTLKCSGWEASAQLTGNLETITTVAHTFTDVKCKKHSSPTACTFTAKWGDQVQISGISELAAMGIMCPGSPKRKDDWAVLKLRKPMVGIKPYKLPYSDETVHDGDELVAVVASSSDFDRKNPRTGLKESTKAIENCQGRQPYHQNGRLVMFASNCDSSAGSSGGSTLRERRRYDILVGIFSAVSENDQQLSKALVRGSPNRGVYQEGEWMTYHIPLTGKFLEAVQRAVGDRNYYSD